MKFKEISKQTKIQQLHAEKDLIEQYSNSNM